MKFFSFLICFSQIVLTFKCVYIPKWSDNYHVKATIRVPEANFIQPFEVWYDKKSQRSRVDYYNGMDKTYQTYDHNSHGSEYKIFPYTDEKKFNVEQCLERVGTSSNQVNIQPALYPIENMFRFNGYIFLNGGRVQEWIRKERPADRNDNRRLQFTFLVNCTKPEKESEECECDDGTDTSDESSSNKDDDDDDDDDEDDDDDKEMNCVPLRLEMRGRNLLFESHVGNYFIDYHLYEPNIVTPDVLTINYPNCKDMNTFHGHHRTRIMNPLAGLLPSLSKIVQQNRGFDAFTRRHGSHFRNHKEFRKRFANFQKNNRRLKSKTGHSKWGSYKREFKQFFDFDKLDLSIFNKRLPSRRLESSKNKRKLKSAYYEAFDYSKEDLKELEKYDNYDLSKSGALNPIQSQLHCGSCWAFSTAAALEGTYYLKHHGHRVKLSEQALIDCSWGFDNLGCDGGADVNALEWIKKHGGLPLQNNYGPYKANNGYCLKQNQSETVRVIKYKAIRTGDYQGIQIALIKNGPVLASMHASLDSFLRYQSGVYNDPECMTTPESLDHAVVIVGFGYQNGNLYWIVRNTWSRLWGINGYGWVMAKNNACGLSTLAYVVYVA